MRVRLQELTPYQDCLRWQIQADYYRDRGRSAFTSNEVPAYITSNYFAARQQARLLLAAHAGDDEVKVLECGGGSGWFAYNFIRAFGDVCEASGRKLRLRYLLTDAAAAALQELALQARYAGWIASGRLRLGLLDLNRPDQACTLDGAPLGLRSESQDLIVGNYSFCTLPVVMLRKQQGAFEQRHVRLFYPHLSPGPYDQRLIEEEESYLPLPSEFAALMPFLQTLAQDLDQATFPLALGSLSALEGLLPLLRPGGMLLISDKALTDAWQLETPAASRCTFHGQSLAHYVNFPLLANYAQSLGASTLQTHAPSDELQTLLIVKAPTMPAQVAASFGSNYTEFNQNHVFGSLKSACQALYEQGQLEVAARHYAKLLLHDPQHAEALYVVARHMLTQKAWDWALRALETPEDDCLELFDFAHLRALALEGLNRHRDAIEAHQLSLRRSPEAEVWYGLGRCHLALREPEQARAAFRQALGLQPDHAQALEALREL